MRHVAYERLQYFRKTHIRARKRRQHREWIQCLVLQFSPRCLYITHSARHIHHERKSVACYITDITLSQWLLGRQPSCAQDSELAPDRSGRKGRKGSNIVRTYIPYDLLQTKGETCAKFGWDRFRNVDLYKVQIDKRKQTKKNISPLYIRFEAFIITLSGSTYIIWQCVAFFVFLWSYPDDDCKSDRKLLVINNIR
jgi:hypothetical protein